MPVITTPAPDPATTRPAQDPQRVVRPWSARSSDQDEAVLHWQALVDARLIGGNPPTPPEVVAQRDANEALFRSFARARTGALARVGAHSHVRARMGRLRLSGPFGSGGSGHSPEKRDLALNFAQASAIS